MKRLARLSKVSMLTSMAAVVMVMLPSNSSCPAVDPLDHTVLLPNPADCSSFFSCSNGVPILMHCPDGMYFNAKLDVCDWPQYVGCNGSELDYRDKLDVKISESNGSQTTKTVQTRKLTCIAGGYFACDAYHISRDYLGTDKNGNEKWGEWEDVEE